MHLMNTRFTGDFRCRGRRRDRSPRWSWARSQMRNPGLHYPLHGGGFVTKELIRRSDMLLDRHKTKTFVFSKINPRMSQWLGYLLAVAGVAVGALIRWAFMRAIGNVPPYLTFYPVVFVAAVVGGTGPGVLATILSALTVDVLYIEPVGSLAIGTTGEAVAMAFFIVVSFGISILGGRFRTK